MGKNKKIIIGVIILLFIIVIGIVVAYKLIENSVTNRENYKANIENISSTPVDTVNLEESLIYEETVSPNENYVNYNEEKVFYTIRVYKKENNIIVKSSSNTSFAKELQYEINSDKDITKDNIKIEWTTLMGDTNFTKENQIGIAVVTLSYDDEIFSQRKISFVSNAIDVIVDTIK